MNEPLYSARHEPPFEKMFGGCDIHLVIGALTLDVVSHEITRPRRTWVREAADPTEREIPGAMAGVIYGRGNVEMSRTKAFIELGGDDMAIIPHGKLEPLTEEERAICQPAEWKFTFDYSFRPVSEPMD